MCAIHCLKLKFKKDAQETRVKGQSIPSFRGQIWCGSSAGISVRPSSRRAHAILNILAFEANVIEHSAVDSYYNWREESHLQLFSLKNSQPALNIIASRPVLLCFLSPYLGGTTGASCTVRTSLFQPFAADGDPVEPLQGTPTLMLTIISSLYFWSCLWWQHNRAFLIKGERATTNPPPTWPRTPTHALYNCHPSLRMLSLPEQLALQLHKYAAKWLL